MFLWCTDAQRKTNCNRGTALRRSVGKLLGSLTGFTPLKGINPDQTVQMWVLLLIYAGLVCLWACAYMLLIGFILKNWPVHPIAPFGPLNPCGPGGPSIPGIPYAPGGPWLPDDPLNPLSPRAPRSPWRPGFPGIPGGPENKRVIMSAASNKSPDQPALICSSIYSQVYSESNSGQRMPRWSWHSLPTY